MRYDECGKFLDLLDAVREWSGKVSDVAYMAVMQHYGLPTHMIDITSDIRTALFLHAASGRERKLSAIGNR